MATSEEDGYDLERAIQLQSEIYSNSSTAIRVIEGATEQEVIDYLLDKHEEHPVETPIDVRYNGKQGMGDVRRAILESDVASSEDKQEVATRHDQAGDLDVLVPSRVRDNALSALAAGKPVVLYGPTGTGKTTFAKQLAMATSVGYDLHTASPSWNDQDIVGRIAPDYSEGDVEYRKEPGCVSQAVLRAKDFDEKWTVIIDELTRADISRIFGPLYTAIETPSQTIFETDDGDAIGLDPRVNIICTMNISDRTVNELDNAITRRFAMIEVSEYDVSDREALFEGWVDRYLDDIEVDVDALLELFHNDYRRLNEGGDSGDGIMQFGPMHYEDVIKFIAQACSPDPDPAKGRYENRFAEAVGEAFRTYILPRLLNVATYQQIEDIAEHYRDLDEEFDNDTIDLSRAATLADRRYQDRQQRMGG